MRKEVATTKNGKLVYAEDTHSHAATHLADTPGLLALVQELIAGLTAEGDTLYTDKDMGRIVGISDLVETTPEDEIVYAKRLNRDTYTRFVLHKEPQATRLLTVVLHKDSSGAYELWSAWIGPATPQFPGDQNETADSKPFWRTHALIWGNQAIQPNTQVSEWPWD